MEQKRLVTAEEMEAMSPNERAAIVESGTLRGIHELPEPFRTRVRAKADLIEISVGPTRER